MNTLTVIAAQLNFLVGDIEGNTQLIINTAQKCKMELNADLVVFPELTITSYPPEDLLFRPYLYKRVHEALFQLCQSIKDICIIVGYPDQIDGKRYNMAAVIQDGEIKATYAKKELPNYTVFDEKRYFSSGDKTTIFKLKNTKIAIIICEDTWFDKPIQDCARAGADLIISLNASPFALDKEYARRIMLEKQSKAAQLPIVYVNLVGGQDELVFDGGSMVFDATGKLKQQAHYYQEDLMKIEFNLDQRLNILTAHTLPPEPQTEEKLYKVLILGVRDYIRKNHFPSAVIGLSGGIDSALTLAIACDAIGGHNVEAIMMPSRYTSTMSLDDAKAQVKLLNCHYVVMSIENIFKCFLTALHDEFQHYPLDTTEENLQARCRGTLLMAISNKKRSIVLTTGNKSEMAVGYATLYGDMAGGFSVLKDVFKTMVYRLSHYRNSLSMAIPERVIQRPPSAELANNQLDQDMLPPYSVLDEILERFLMQEQDAFTIAKAGYDLETIKKIVRMVNSNEYKRRQAPLGIRLTEKAFGKDRRYPITSGYFKKYYEHL
ncbi:MAG: NAD+ synthase [Coxiella sp. RIFCSPHIGHO2_12_FULL_42_15]|nr:MAG: NAD+ synthase [Coxiella sp. RIFCSPHIGHO2_12_FULL_42_15]